MINRRAALITSLGLMGSPIYAINFKLQGILLKRALMGSGIESYSFFLGQYVSLGVLYLLALVLVFRPDLPNTKSPNMLYAILFFAILYRLFLLPTHPMFSSDMYRYIWDGRTQSHGINPYHYPPNHEALQGLRDNDIYPHINRKGAPTIYPAGAQVLFYLLHKLGAKSVVSFKGALLLFDMGSIFLLVMILGDLGLRRERVLVYAWNPLVIYELANNGHLDGSVIFFLLLALWLLIKKRANASVSSLAAATSLKLYPLMVLPAILKEKKFRRLLLFLSMFSLFYIPYLSLGRKVLGFLPEYLLNPYESFNLGLKVYLMRLFPSLNYLFITAILTAALFVAAGSVWIKNKGDLQDALKFAYILAGLQLVLTSASLQPWYLLWIIPFLTLFPSPAWLYFSLVVPFSYLKYQSPQGIFPEWVRHMEYIPFLIFLTAEYVIFYMFPRVSFPLRLSGENEPSRTNRDSVQ
jgi:alpha-1,6-mannosyltransferase